MTPSSQLLNPSEAKELSEKIKKACVSAHASIQAAGRWLIELRDKEGWRALGYDSWNKCLDGEFMSAHGGRRKVFRLIQNAEVIENVNQTDPIPVVSASESTKTGDTRVTTLKLPIRQTQELAKAEPEMQHEALKIAVDLGGGTATEATIKKAVASLKDAKEIRRDSTGYAIPEKLWPLWERRNEIEDILKAISKARVAVKDAHNSKDILFSPSNMNGAYAKLCDVYNTVQMSVPYAVCATCQGQATDSCTSCKGRGFISKQHYETCVPEELKTIRDKSCVKG